MKLLISSPSEHNARGSALLYILIAVALFAALGFAVSNMMRSGGAEMASEEKAGLMADEILGYARQVRQAVQDMRISNGCDETDISFENTVVSGYTNGANTACQVFHSDGGGLSWIAPASAITSNPWVFQGRYNISNIGTSNKELLMSLSGISQAVCEKINERVGVTNPSGPPTNDSFDVSVKFTGTYDDLGALVAGDSGEETNFAGKPAACFDGPSSGTYHFYQVLIAR